MSTTRTFKVTNQSGRTFNVSVTRPNELFVFRSDLINDYPQTTVEFADATYENKKSFGTYGQFIAEYYLSTLLDDADRLSTYGLDLMGHVPNWKIDAPTMRTLLEWLRQPQRT